MRVYEFSKQCDVPSKELLEILAQGGFKLSSHMSVLDDEAVAFLKARMKKASAPIAKNEDAVKEQSLANKEVKQPVQSVEKQAQKITPSPVQVQERKKDGARELAGMQTSSEVLKESTAQESIALTLESMKVDDFAQRAKKSVSDVIVTLLRWGIVAAKNQILSEDIVTRLARHYALELVAKSKDKQEELSALTSVAKEALAHRLPVVVVLGHVDHGKTSLLDFIRKTRVASREKGGITQHIGAYEAKTAQGNIVFIDTPGHEAFSKMRMRGIKVADLAILVVAADDGVMPQTVEAIKYAKSMSVPILVAINKIDKVEPSRVDVIKRELVQHDLLAEDWGGEVVFVPISAKTGQGIDQLLDMIILQSQLMELQADVTGTAQGYVLEAKLEKGHGPVGTVICQHGKLRVGDFFSCGATAGKVNALVNSAGQRVVEVGPSIPVLVAGFESLPNAGDLFTVVSKEEFKKVRVQQSSDQRSDAAVRGFIAQSGDINMILKTDTNSSKEAILSSLHTLAKKFEKKFSTIHAAVGDVNESDVTLAATTGSLVFAYNVKAEPNALSLAQKLGVTIRTYEIIYKLLESLQEIAEGAREVKMVRTKIGEATVRQVFNIKGLGVIAGCYVKDGRFTRDGSVVAYRGKQKIGEGKIKSLQREKKVVKEVHAGYECGILIDGIDAWEVDDRVECFVEMPETPKK
jgi:translation initiation factor IF-2